MKNAIVAAIISMSMSILFGVLAAKCPSFDCISIILGLFSIALFFFFTICLARVVGILFLD